MMWERMIILGMAGYVAAQGGPSITRVGTEVGQPLESASLPFQTLTPPCLFRLLLLLCSTVLCGDVARIG